MLEEPVRQLELDLAFVANALRGKDTEEGLSRLLRFSRKLPLILCALEPSAARILGQTSAAAVMAVAFAA